VKHFPFSIIYSAAMMAVPTAFYTTSSWISCHLFSFSGQLDGIEQIAED
jgi:hypothetical protein